MVLVCHDKRFIFLKTSKTAGTSIEMLLEPFCARPGHVPKEETPPIHSPQGIIGRRMLPARTPKLLHRRWNRWVHHMPASAVRKYLGQDKWQAYSKITIVRNPFDRAASQFYWKNRGVVSPDMDLETQRRAFAAFLDSDKFKTDREIVFIGDDYVIDHAIKFEDMAGGLTDVSKIFGLDLDIAALPHTKNQAKKRKGIHPGDLMGPAERDRIVSLMGWVFDRYGYSTEPANV